MPDWVSFIDKDGRTVIPNWVNRIEDDVFANCLFLRSISYGGTVEAWREILAKNTIAVPSQCSIYCSDGCLDRLGNEIEPQVQTELAEER